MRLPRGISLKLAILFLMIGLLPMASVSVVAYLNARFPLTERPIESFVSQVAQDSAFRTEQLVMRARDDSLLQATSWELAGAVTRYYDNQHLNEIAEETIQQIQSTLNLAVNNREGLDMYVLADLSGRILATSNVKRPPLQRSHFEPEYLWSGGHDSNPLNGQNVTSRWWWSQASTGETTFINWCNEDIILQAYKYPYYADNELEQDAHDRPKNPEAFTFGFTCGIQRQEDGPIPESDPPNPVEPPQAILISFYNWSVLQASLDNTNRQFEISEAYKSGYTFMFDDDLDTIIAHKNRKNYTNSLVQYHKIIDLHEAMKSSRDQGDPQPSICHYTYVNPKIAATALVPSTGWRLGFGIDKVDIYGDAEKLRNWLLLTSLFISGGIVILIAFVSRRVTEPITHLIQQTNEIARGNLDARVEIRTNDEIAVLGDSFNKMAEDLKQSNKRLIKAEKAAAWREMARQVAHEIKNPLTPMKLSAQLVQRAYEDQHPDFEQLLRDSVENIVTQVESLRRIASDFSSFAAFPKAELKPHSVRKLLESCIQMYGNRSASGVAVESDIYFDESLNVLVDGDALQRVFLNLFNNAFESMQKGGTLTLTATALDNTERGRVVDIRIKDTGTGIPEEIRDKLFEPYFTTRSSGTGLGLAITRKTIEGLGGEISLESTEGVGTVVILIIPIHENDSPLES